MGRGNIVFLHPDLGVGGAERLVVDAALSLKNSGYDVSFVTSHHNKNHCFDETKNGTLPVTVVGDFLPRHIFGKFFALCAYIRMIYSSLYVIFFLQPDVVFCDIISVCIPILHLKVPKVFFYCHFPDQLLSQKGSLMKSFYRLPLDWLEEITTGAADKLFVNSNFTKSVFQKTFKSISISPDILYPSINMKPFDKECIDSISFRQQYGFPDQVFVFLSINRYERKKDVELAIKSLCKLKDILSVTDWERVRLIIAGGYDDRVTENVDYFQELKKISNDMRVSDKCIFLKSPSDEIKISLLKNCHSLLYTPSNEHFGIVPLEAMYSGKPAIAVNSGGPTETVVNGETGFLCQPTENDFAQAMACLINNEETRIEMGGKGRQRFLSKFSFQAFGQQLEKAISEMLIK